MAETPITYWNLVEDVLESIPEEGPLQREQVRIWARWELHLVNQLEQRGFYYRGESVKDQGWSTLLVVKVAHEGTPLVVFVTERTPTDCRRAFLRMMDEGRLEFREDKFG